MNKEGKDLRVIGHNTSDGSLHMWDGVDDEWANSFARQLCEDTGEPVFIVRVVGVWRPAKRPVEYEVAE